MTNGLRLLEMLPEAVLWLHIMFTSGYNSKRMLYRLRKTLVVKGLNNFATADNSKSCILCTWLIWLLQTAGKL